MATIILTANTDVSALTLANGDTIDLAGFTLNIDSQPTATGIQVVSPGTAGRVTFSSGWNLSTWDFFVGTSGSLGMIATLPAGASIGTITAGGSNHRGVGTNNGSIGLACGGNGSGSHGVTTNNGFIATAKAGTTNNAHGALSNNGTVITAESVASNSNGVNGNTGQILRLVTGSAPAVAAWNGTLCFVEGPFINGIIPSNIKTIYSLGPLSNNATIANDAIVIELAGYDSDTPPVFDSPIFRMLEDTSPIFFDWVRGGVEPVVSVAFDNVNFVPVNGTVTDLGARKYRLSYHVDDRPTTAGIITYKVEEGAEAATFEMQLIQSPAAAIAGAELALDSTAQAILTQSKIAAQKPEIT